MFTTESEWKSRKGKMCMKRAVCKAVTQRLSGASKEVLASLGHEATESNIMFSPKT